MHRVRCAVHLQPTPQCRMRRRCPCVSQFLGRDRFSTPLLTSWVILAMAWTQRPQRHDALPIESPNYQSLSLSHCTPYVTVSPFTCCRTGKAWLVLHWIDRSRRVVWESHPKHPSRVLWVLILMLEVHVQPSPQGGRVTNQSRSFHLPNISIHQSSPYFLYQRAVWFLAPCPSLEAVSSILI